MLLTNQWLDKLATSRADFKARGMLTASLYPFNVCVNLNFRLLADMVICLSTDHNVAPSTPAPPPPMAAHEDNDNDDEVAVAGPQIQAQVNLTKTITCIYIYFLIFLLP